MAHDVYTALSDPTRRRILTALRGGARPVGDLVVELEVSQPTVSKHLKVLRDVDLVATRAEGQKRYYSVAPEPLTEALAWIQHLFVEHNREDAAPHPTHVVAPPPAADVATPPVAHTRPSASDRADPATDARENADISGIAQPEPAEAETREVEAAPEAADLALSAAEPEAELRSPARAVPWWRGVEDAASEPAEATVAVSEKNFEISSEGPVPAEIETDHAIGDRAITSVQESLHEGAPRAEVTDISAVVVGVDAGARTPEQGISVGHDTDVRPAGESFYPSEAAQRDLEHTDAGLPSALGGVPYRRQSGLLSTLTGLRRRGKNSRR